jgi:hypothetical protein
MDSTKNNMATVKQSTKDLTADKFIKDLKKTIAMRDIFALAKEYMQMPLVEIEKLLDSEIHEARTGAVSIMDWKARHKQTTEEETGSIPGVWWTGRRRMLWEDICLISRERSYISWQNQKIPGNGVHQL